MSLDSIALIAEIEKRFNINLSSKETEKIFTIRQLSEYVAKETGKELEVVEFGIMTILHESLGVEWKLLKPDTDIVNDLGID